MTSTLIDRALRQLATSAPVLLYIADTQLQYLYVNEFFSQTHNVSPEDVIGNSISSVIGPTAFNANLVYYQRVLQGEAVSYSSQFIKPDGVMHHYTAIYEPLFEHGSVVGFTGVVIDKTLEQELVKLCNTDALTRTSNRRKFETDINKCLSTWQSGCFLILDLDHFKQVNDQLGHHEGDKVLINFSRLLHKLAGDSGKVYRIGGEEFAVLCAEVDSVIALKQYAEKICEQISKNSTQVGLSITASIGATLIGKNEQRHQLLKRTDDALYLAKSKGRNQVYYI